ncbi:MAG: ribosome maturation factor RimP [Finegoldia magna]|uniref:Ribosome maturation factor RimP n=1 Tax=Finegoldia magna TaxID=1260 RepID=A0A233VIW7_FINMA|nr:ribosome maturation factor RimP [Finegoldia magna]MDU1399160.1 ribosome maturation factor RimP [Finegoldia magna]MDU2897789.1 ribosome maturation factor RimP [Finegoldia magna]MDU3192614.1 ribosome maturation factor RimP [Finegoldia magna]MDU5368403.1 ribosome maturation factor RimP [Finegoldia magna]MDU5444573.1 ribosome maturation factor RimP [Finegoldia magna]
MNKKYLRELMNNDLSPLIEDTGIDFYDVEYSNQNGKNILTFYIEKDEGLISIDDCELINNRITDKLDEIDPISDPYYLEIASVDITTPFTRDKDFKKNLGNVVIVNLYQKLDNKKEFKGILKDFNNQEISLELEKNQIKIERSNISSIKLSLFD